MTESKTKDTVQVSVNLLASSKIDDVNSAVAFYENTLGPLIQMKIDNDTTLLKFDAVPPKPNPFAIVAKQVGGIPQVPTGAELVATGQIYIEGTPTLCAATRADIV